MPAHTWSFVRSGGFDQVAIDTADDLRHLGALDQKLWVALACPVTGNELDDATLALVDGDGDGRIRAPDLLAAIAWIDSKLVDLGATLEARDGLVLANIADDTIRASAARILKAQGKEGGLEVCVAHTTAANDALNKMPFNGDGVVPASSAQDEAVAAVITNIVDTMGGLTDRNGEPGVTRERVETFWGALEAYAAWVREAEEGEDTVVPLGAATAPAVEAFAAVRPKIDDYFTRCDLAAFDPRAQGPLSGAEAQWSEMAGRTLATTDDDIKAFPLAAIAPGKALPLTEGINPAWVEAMSQLVRTAVTPLLGEQEVLDRAQWADSQEPVRRLRGVARQQERHRGGAAGHRTHPGAARQRPPRHGGGPDRPGRVAQAGSRRRARRRLGRAIPPRPVHPGPQLREASGHYDPQQKAMFQAGTLYLDGRSCELVVRIEDVAKHAAVASQSYVFLAYCVCTRPSANETLHIAAAFTDGDSDFLAVGRNGLFYDRQGRDWDATITKVVEQPISLRQAFWAPYKRLVRFVSDQAEAFAASQEKASSANLTSRVSAGTTDLQAATAPAGEGAAVAPSQGNVSAFDIGKFAGIFAAIGLAMGFMASAATMVVTGFMALRMWEMPLALLGVLLLVSGPSVLVAAFKLSRRNLASVLDANGWAINTRARINIPFGASLTDVAQLPPGARRQLIDPYAEKKRPWWLLVLVVVLVSLTAFLWDMGLSEWVGVALDMAPTGEAEMPVTPAPGVQP